MEKRAKTPHDACHAGKAYVFLTTYLPRVPSMALLLNNAKEKQFFHFMISILWKNC